MQGKNPRNISNVTGDVHAGQTLFWRYAYLSDVSELRFNKDFEVGGKGVSVIPSRLCRTDFHYDAGLLYPSASIRIISMAGRTRGIIWAFSSYFFILIPAGHIWKFVTLAYIPPTIAGVVLAYRKKYLLGGVITALFIALQIQSNHIQMSYYFMFVILFFIIAYFVDAYERRNCRISLRLALFLH